MNNPFNRADLVALALVIVGVVMISDAILRSSTIYIIIGIFEFVIAGAQAYYSRQ